ncbi:MAG: sigma-70 family RNA polymerase sigma factor [Muribaculaceae bacterium]|nr:sigma-70 family RNA polymerase sigma factor [Muribaculaceae bacterium]
MENAQLIHNCKEGDKDAMEFLYRRYRHKMMKVIRRYLHEDEAAEDVLHDGFIIIFSRIGEVRNPDRLEFWMATVIRNLCLDYLTSLDVTSMLDESEEIADMPELEEIIPYEELIKIIDRLPKGYREIFRLAVMENKSHKEIGKLLGINPNSSSSQLFHARQLLRKMVNERKHELGFLSFLIVLASSILFLMVKNPRLTHDHTAGRDLEKSIPSEKSIIAPASKQEVSLADLNPQAKPNKNFTSGNSLLSGNTKKGENINLEKNLSKPDTLLSVLTENVAQDALELNNKEKEDCKENEDSVDNKTNLHFEGSKIIASTSTAGSISGKYKRRVSEPWSFSLAYNFGGLSEVNIGSLPLSNSFFNPGDNNIDNDNDQSFMVGDGETPETEDGNQQMNTRGATRSLPSPSVSEVENELPLTIAFTLSKHLNPKLSIETGLEYTLAHTSFHLKSVYGDGKRKMRSQYIGVPVRMRYDCLSFSKFTLFGITGMGVDIPVKNSVVASVGITTVEISKPKTQFSLSAGVGLQFNINSHFGIYVIPSLRYNIPTHSMVPTYWQQHPFCFSLPFGFKATL